MIVCPTCGADSVVLETRGQRRRRACALLACNTKFSTVELVTVEHGEHVAIKRATMDKLRAAIGGAK